MSQHRSAIEAHWARLAEAAGFAFACHRAQMRKGTDIPYLSHLMGVASLVLEYGGDEDQAMAGLLHDVLEDCGMDYLPAIRSRFGEQVAMIVEACTDGTPDAQGDKAPWQERKQDYLAHLRLAPASVLLVSASDKLHNARSIVTDQRETGGEVFSRFKAGKDGTLWYYGELSRIFSERLPGRLARELERTVTTMLELAAR